MKDIKTLIAEVRDDPESNYSNSSSQEEIQLLEKEFVLNSLIVLNHL